MRVHIFLLGVFAVLIFIINSCSVVDTEKVSFQVQVTVDAEKTPTKIELNKVNTLKLPQYSILFEVSASASGKINKLILDIHKEGDHDHDHAGDHTHDDDNFSGRYEKTFSDVSEIKHSFNFQVKGKNLIENNPNYKVVIIALDNKKNTTSTSFVVKFQETII